MREYSRCLSGWMEMRAVVSVHFLSFSFFPIFRFLSLFRIFILSFIRIFIPAETFTYIYDTRNCFSANPGVVLYIGEVPRGLYS